MGEKLMAIEVHFEKRIINNNVIREADSRSHRDYVIVTALAAMFLFGLFTYGWQHYQYVQYGYRIEEAENKKEQLTDMRERLRLDRASLRNLERVDFIARRQLGMVIPAPGQFVTLSADAPLTIPTPQPPEAEPAALAAQR